MPGRGRLKCDCAGKPTDTTGQSCPQTKVPHARHPSALTRRSGGRLKRGTWTGASQCQKRQPTDRSIVRLQGFAETGAMGTGEIRWIQGDLGISLPFVQGDRPMHDGSCLEGSRTVAKR